MSPEAVLMSTSPVSSSKRASPDAVATLSPPHVPRASVSADAVVIATSAPRGAHTRRMISPPMKSKSLNRLRCTSTTISWPSRCGRSSTRALSITSRSSSESRVASSSTRVADSSCDSSEIVPEGRRRSRRSGPGVEKVSCLTAHPRGSAGAHRAGGASRSSPRHVRRALETTPWLHLLSGLRPACNALSRPRWPPRAAALDGARERADEPVVDGDALCCRGRLDRRLQRLGQAQRDPSLLVLPHERRRVGLGGLARDEHELRVLPCDANVDVAVRQLLRELERDRKSTRLNSSHQIISYAVFCLKKKKREQINADEHMRNKTLTSTKR